MSDGLDPLDPSPYKTLNVAKDAPLSTIRSAHRKLVLLCHPDKVQNEADKKIKGEQFHQVQQAYEILSDDTRRRRWDERAKLAELRAEIMREERTPPPPRRAQTFASPRHTQSPVFEYQNGRMYEERVPKATRAYTGDFPSTYAEARTSSRKAEERYDETPKKTSGRGPEERRRYAVDDEYYERKEREKRAKNEEATRRAEKEMKRTKERRKDFEAKTNSRRTYVEDEVSSASDSDGYDVPRKSPDYFMRREDHDDRRHREDSARASGKKGARGRVDDKLERQESAAYEYMRRSSEQVDVDTRRPGRKRADSYRDRGPQMPPSPPLTPIDPGRRSSSDDRPKASGRGRTSRAQSPIGKSSKSKPMPEIVDQPSSRKPKMQASTSDRSHLQNMTGPSKARNGPPQRSATDMPHKEFIKPGLKRSETMPIDHMQRTPVASKQARSNNKSKDLSDIESSSSSDDSDSDSDNNATPLRRPQPQARQTPQTFRYRVRDEDRASPTVYGSPDEYHDRSRDHSPKNLRRSAATAAAAVSSDRHARPSPTSRAATFNEKASPRASYDNHDRSTPTRAPPLKTHSSARVDKLPYEISPDHSPKEPKFFETSSRRHDKYSTPRRSSRDVDPDAYPGSHSKSHRRPALKREVRA